MGKKRVFRKTRRPKRARKSEARKTRKTRITRAAQKPKPPPPQPPRPPPEPPRPAAKSTTETHALAAAADLYYFDKLPAEVREAVNGACWKINSVALHDLMERGMSLREILAKLDQFNREHGGAVRA